MKPEIIEAIARVTAADIDGKKIAAGTAFLVTERHLLTAYHVIGDRKAAARTEGRQALYPVLSISFEERGQYNLAGQVLKGCFDFVEDWALIELRDAVREVKPVTLGTIGASEVSDGNASLKFESWGYPTIDDPNGSALIIDGRVQGVTPYQNAKVYQLYSDNAAAGKASLFYGYSGAPCVVDGAVVGIIRSNLPDKSDGNQKATSIGAGVLYACPVSSRTLQDRCGTYLPALDPIRGLPGLPRQHLPNEPFRYLHWYGAEHAEVFFGRNRKIRDLFLQLMAADAPPVVLMYGTSGVGKSSLLEAGLLPRLSWNYEVRVQRRETFKSLAQTFEDQFSSAQAAGASNGKTPLVVLDQIEEIFADPRVDGNVELRSLAERINGILEQSTCCPRILIGFRSEWLANVRARFKEVKVSFGEFYLERLTKDEVAEVVEGIASTDRLRAFYAMGVDPDLPTRVADDLLSDPKSPISPLLSIILTRLWDEAKEKLPQDQRLNREAYDVQMRNKLDLDRFLTEQISAVATSRPEDVKSGLVNDVLYRHTTDFGTAKELSWKEVGETYSHLVEKRGASELQTLMTVLASHSLLHTAESKDDSSGTQLQNTRLAHDTLALPVRRSYSKSDFVGQRAARRLASGVEDWQPSNPDSGTLDAPSLKLIEQGLPGTRAPTQTENAYIKASIEACKTARNRAVLIGALVAVLGVFSIGAPVAWWKQDWIMAQAYWIVHVHARDDNTLKSGEEFIECSHCPRMIVVPSGRIQIGSSIVSTPEQQKEQPAANVDFEKPFAVGRFEVTLEEWRACAALNRCQSGPADGQDRGKWPVTNISWNDAQNYVNWLSQITNRKYRLLSEAEWEYAARADNSAHFFFGPDEKELGQYAWFGGGLEQTDTHEVGKKKANKFGLFDVYGNAAEWVEDCFRDNYGDGPQRLAWKSDDCSSHVVRGGSYVDRARRLRSAARDWSKESAPTIGLRVGRSIEPRP